MRSRSYSFGVAGEERCVTDVLEAAEEHHHSLQTDSTTSVGIGSVLEGLEIVGDSLRVNSFRDSSLFQQDRVVDPLSSRQDFLSSHEEIVRAGEVGVVLAEHGVEGSGGGGIAMEHVEVSIIFMFD